MFRSVLLKTLFEKRWMLLGWSLGVVAMALLMMTFYDSFSQGGFDEALDSLPDQLKGLVGDTANLKTVPGFVSQQIFELRVPMLTIIMAVILYAALLAGDEDEGVLQSLLAQPVKRSVVYWQKFAAGASIVLLVSLASIIGVWIGLLVVDETMSTLRLVQSAVGVWAITMVFGSLTYAIGAASGKKGLAGSMAGIGAFFFFMISSFAPSVSWLEDIEKYLSPFYYYNSPSIANVGLDMGNIIVLLALAAISSILGYMFFVRRDVQL